VKSIPAELGGHISRNPGAVRMSSNDPYTFVQTRGRRLIGMNARSGAVSENRAHPLNRFENFLGHRGRLKDF
jgi:hypothetical protein